MDIAKERAMDLRQVLTHNVHSASPLFDGDLPTHTSKSLLVGEIETGLDLTQWSPETKLATHVVIDFMSITRQMHIAQFCSFGAVIDFIIKSALRLSQNVNYVHTNFILTTFIECLTPTSKCR
jgi:hypothetical protein